MAPLLRGLTAAQATALEEKEADFNGDFIARMLPRINWDVLAGAAESVSRPRWPLAHTLH